MQLPSIHVISFTLFLCLPLCWVSFIATHFFNAFHEVSSCGCPYVCWVSFIATHFLMPSMKSVRPCRIIVSLQPRSTRHTGQVFDMALGSKYHMSTHCWQPKIFQQHFVTINGGLTGIEWQMWHLKVSRRTLRNPIRRFVLAVRDIMSAMMSLTSLLNLCSILLSHLLCLLAWFFSF